MSELKVNKVTPRSGTTVSLGDSGDSVAIPSGVGFNGFNHRNIVINGDMSIAQRSTSVASITGSGDYTVDRWNMALTGLGTWTQSQSTDVPTGQGFAKSLKLDCTTANASPSAGDNILIIGKFEGQNLQYLKKGTASAQSLTLSFWVKSTKTGTFIAEIRDFDNTRAISKSYTVNVTNTWEKKTITYEGDTTGAFDNDNGSSLQLQFWLGAGTNFTSGTLATTWSSRTFANVAVGVANIADSTANEWYITGVQLEAGTTASDFEFLPFDVNLARCQRYCLKYGGTNIFDPLAIGIAASSTELYTFLDFRTQMRATPSVTSSTLQTNDFSTQQAVTALVTIANQTNNSMGYVKATVASGLTQFRPHFLQSANSTSAYLIFSAEL
jgi:hypothetical protein